MDFTFPSFTFTMESFGLLGINAVVLFAMLFSMKASGLMGGPFLTFAFQMVGCLGLDGLFPTFTFQNIERLGAGGLIGIFTINESEVLAWG